MDQSQNHNQSNRRIIFTRDAAFTVKRFDGKPEDKPESIATLTGYAIRWNSLSDDRGGYKVRLLPGSAHFATPTMALFHHNFASIIGNTANGSLRISPDEVGVKVEIDLPDTATGRDTEELVENGYVGGMSFAMTGTPIFKMTTEAGQQVMNVSSFDSDEITVTAVPAFADTSVAVTTDNVPEEADEPTPPTQLAKAEKNDDGTKVRDAQGLKLDTYRLAALAEYQQ